MIFTKLEPVYKARYFFPLRFTIDNYNSLKINRKSKIVIRTFWDKPSLNTHSNYWENILASFRNILSFYMLI